MMISNLTFIWIKGLSSILEFYSLISCFLKTPHGLHKDSDETLTLTFLGLIFVAIYIFWPFNTSYFLTSLIVPQLCDTYLPVEIVEEFETIALQFHCSTNIKATFLSDQVTLLNLVTLYI